MHKESLLEVVNFIEAIIDELECELIPLDEVADTPEELTAMITLQTKIDTLSELILDMMSFDWEEK
jgi:hypothetical protein